jgi:hypothetical protein
LSLLEALLVIGVIVPHWSCALPGRHADPPVYRLEGLGVVYRPGRRAGLVQARTSLT